MTQTQSERIYSNEKRAPKKTARISEAERKIIATLKTKHGRA